MSLTVICYLLYIAISTGLTIWVAWTLSRNGRTFLITALGGKEALADSVNHLLVVGFYLINLGYMSLALKLGYEVADGKELVEALSTKVGLVVVVLGVMHFANLFLLHKLQDPKEPRPSCPDLEKTF